MDQQSLGCIRYEGFDAYFYDWDREKHDGKMNCFRCREWNDCLDVVIFQQVIFWKLANDNCYDGAHWKHAEKV